MEEEDGKEEEGDDELEEIEEGVFDGSQSPKKKKRMTNYMEIEDTCLVRAWSSVTIDSVTGNDQTDKRYWQLIVRCSTQLGTPRGRYMMSTTASFPRL
jgi:hypothetical protein